MIGVTERKSRESDGELTDGRGGEDLACGTSTVDVPRFRNLDTLRRVSHIG
jgi:hypothetical protein